MEPERIELSQPERERLKVLHEVEPGHWPQVEAAQRLRLSDRQVRRLPVRVRVEGGRTPERSVADRPARAHTTGQCSAPKGSQMISGAKRIS